MTTPTLPLALLLTLFMLAMIAPAAHAQEAAFSFTNPTFVDEEGTNFYEFDVTLASPSADYELGDTQVYIDYNTAGFGSGIVASGGVSVEKGTLIDQDNGPFGPSYTIINVIDNDANTFAVTIEYNFATAGAGESVVDAAQQLIRVRIEIADPAETAGLSFNGLLEGQTFTSDDTQITDYTYSSTDNSVLPVELTAFDAALDGTDVLLSWQTASETNNAGFELQRRSKMEDPTASNRWETLGWIEGNGTTLEAQRYSHRVSDLPAGTHTFRLKQIDYDGAFEYSPEVEMTVGVAGDYEMSAAYPNPFNPQTQFTLAVARAQEVNVEVYNLLGQRVDVLFAGEVPANQTRTIVWQAGDRPSGVYFLRIRGERFVETRRVTLLK